MATTQDILLTYKTDTGEVTRSLEDIVSGLEGVDNKIEETAKQTSKVGKGLKSAAQLGATGFKALGTAIAATGIGLLIGLIAGLTAKMAENKKIAEAFEVVVSAVGAAFNILVQKIEPFAGLVIDAFSNPVESIQKLGDAIKQNIQNRIDGILTFIPKIGQAWDLLTSGKWKEASKVAADAVGQVVLGVTDITDKIGDAADAVGEFASNYVDEVGKATQSATKLTQEQQKLRDQQRELNVEYAQARAEIEQLKQKRDDERLSIEERIEAAQRASELDQEFADKREAIANAEVALIQREIAIQGDSIERQDELAEARIAAAEAAESSAAVQTELMTSIYGLEQESIAIEQEKIDKRRETTEETIGLLEEEEAAKKLLAEEDAKRREDTRQAIIDTAKSSLSALADLNEAFGYKSIERQNKIDDLLLQASETKDQSEKESLEKKAKALGKIQDREGKKQFERGKALSIAQALISTYESATAAFNSLANIPVVGVGLGIAAAGAAVVAGLANVKKIKSQTYKSQGTGGGSSYSSSGSGGSGQQAPTSPQLDLSFLGGGAGQDGFRTYVIASEVSNSQQANQKINDQAALVG